MRISHSAKETYLQCPQKYYLHYIRKLRSPLAGSPLFAGSAFDDAVSVALLGLKKELTAEEKELVKLDPHTTLDNQFTTMKLNGESVYLPTYRYAKYFMTDYEPDLLEEEDLIMIRNIADLKNMDIDTLDKAKLFAEECRVILKNKTPLSADEQVVYNCVVWCSLRRKLHFLLDKYIEDVLPLLSEVTAVQKKVSLEDGEHSLIGYIDFKAYFKDEPDIEYTIDNKLASKPYPKDAVEVSPQLATYTEHEESDFGAFIVTEKKLRKKNPRHRIQILKGQVQEETYDETFESYSEVIQKIENEEFDHNFEDKCFHFGSKCPYYDYCREGEMGILVDLKKETKDS